jgi:hypothetical protein
MLSFDDFPFDPAFLAYAKSDAGAETFGDGEAAILLPKLTAVGFVAGDAARASKLVEAMLDADIFQHRPRVILSVPDAGWRDALLAVEFVKSFRVQRVDMAFGEQRKSRSVSTELAPLTGELLNRVGGECDLDFEAEYFRSLNGFGWCAVDDSRVVSVAWAPALAGWAEIGVTTATSHRRRGLARGIGDAVLNEALLRGLRPHVSTNRENLAAIRWARSSGFAGERHHDWVVLTKR